MESVEERTALCVGLTISWYPLSDRLSLHRKNACQRAVGSVGISEMILPLLSDPLCSGSLLLDRPAQALPLARFWRLSSVEFCELRKSDKKVKLTDSNTSQISPTACFSLPLIPAVVMAVHPTKESRHTSNPNTRPGYTSLFPYCSAIL